MGISFNHPIYLILIPLVFYPVYLWYRNAWHFSLTRRRLITALRIIILASLILALAGMEIFYELKGQKVVFVVDISASCEKAKEKAESYIRKALRNKNADDEAAIVVYGGNARVEQGLSKELDLERIISLVDRDKTNLEEGLKLADALVPDPSKKRLVVISDGGQNEGDAWKLAQHLRDKQVRIDVVPIKSEPGPDVRIDTLEVPEKLYAGEKFPLRVKISSNIDTGASLRIYQNSSLLFDDLVHLSPGENSFLYYAEIEKSGFHTFSAIAEAAGDNVPENNEASAFSYVHGTPRVLIVEGTPGEGKPILVVLDSLGLEAETISPVRIPANISELNNYQVVFLCNTDAEEINAKAMEAINLGVRDLGMGLVMTGGEQSFGPGGYYGTPVEKALPVNMDLRGKGEIPSLGLVLVIDKSGSMSSGDGGYSKIDLAREAAIQATEILTPRDKVGVVAFDSASKWVVEMQNVEDLQAIQDAIGTIRAGGGTNIFPALFLAFSGLKDADTKYKHIILLTDGRSATSGDYYYLARRMEKASITMSTVAVGTDADKYLMEHLARWGRGRYYYSEDVRSIPRIFTKETIKALREYIIEEEFYPVVTSASPLLEGLNRFPPLDGYVATSPKDTAEVVLCSHRGEPLLAGWQYGLGRSVAFTSDIRGRWNASWISWPDYNHFWGNIISWVLPRSSENNTLIMDTWVDGYTGMLEVDSEELQYCLPTSAIVIGPDHERQEVKLEPVAPGKYRGYFDVKKAGVYLANVTQTGDDGKPRNISGGLTLAYSPEYRTSGTDEDFLQQLAKIGGGAVLDSPGEVFADNLYPVKGTEETWQFLLALAALLLPVEIGVRRLNFSRVDIGSGLNKIKEKLGGQVDLGDHLGTLSRLQEKKRAVQDKISRPEEPGENKRERPLPPNGLVNTEANQDKRRIEDEEKANDDSFVRLLNAKKRVPK